MQILFHVQFNLFGMIPFSARPTASKCLQEVWLQTGMIGQKNVGKVFDMSKLKGHLERTTV